MLLRVGDPGSCEASGTQSDFLQQEHTPLKFPFCCENTNMEIVLLLFSL